MPSIRPIYTQSQVPTGRAAFDSGATNEITAGLAGLGMSVARDVEQHQRAARALAERQRQDEANVFTTNALSRVRAKAQGMLTSAAEEGSLPGVTDRLLSGFDGWGEEELGAAPDKAKAMLKLELAQLRGHLQEKATGIETSARQQQLVDDNNAGLDEDLRVAYADPSQFTELLARRRALVGSLALPPHIREKLSQEAGQGLSMQAASALAERDPSGFLARVGVAGAKTGKDGKPLPSNPEEAAARVKADPILSNMDPGQLRQVVDRATMLKLQREQLAQAAADRAAHQQEMRLHKAQATALSFQMMADKGTILDDATVAQAVHDTAGTPFQAAVVEMARQAKENGGLANQPLSTQDAALDEIDAQIAQHGRSPYLDKRREQLARIASGTREDLEKDPLSAGLQRGWISSVPPLNMNGGIAGLIPQMAPLVAAADAVGSKAGRPVSPFRPQQVQALRDQFDALAPAEKANNLAALASVIPSGQMQAVAKQLDPHDRVLSLAFKAGSAASDQGLPTARLIFLGQQWLRDNGKKGTVDSIPDARIKEMSAAIGQAVPGAVRQDAIDTASLIYLGKQADNQTATAEKSVSLALGGSIIQHNGAPVVTRGTMTQDRFRQGLRIAAPEVRKQTGDTVTSTMGDKESAADFIAGLPQAQLITVGEGRYNVRMGSGIAMNAQGRPLVIEVR